MARSLAHIIALLTVLQAVFALPLTEILHSQSKFGSNSSAIAKRSTNVDDYSVKSLPGLDKLQDDEKPVMHAGYLEANQANQEEYFFWKFSKNQTVEEANNRLIFWFNGGPGCSSLDGALVESGPLTVNKNKEVVYRKGSWLESGDLVFVDQPGGVGFSKTKKYPPELKDIAADMYTFLEQYFKLFPEDAKKDIFLSGESYAGQYIPYFAAKILSEQPSYKLKGLVIFNGYIYPDVQDSALFEFGVENKIITQEVADDAKDDIAKCEQTIKENAKEWSSIISEIESKGEYDGTKDSGSDSNKIASDSCSALLNGLLQATYDSTKPKDQQCVNVYDFKLKDSYPSCGSNFPPEQSQIDNFLNDAGVDKSLNLEGQQHWSECDSGAVGQHLVNRYSYPSYFKLPYILSKIPVMIAAGENDIICNVKGLEKAVSQLKWGGSSSAGFSNNVTYSDYTVDGKVYGQVKYENNLWFGKVADSSHMIPYSQPVGSRGILDIFLGNYKKQDNSYVAPSYGNL